MRLFRTSCLLLAATIGLSATAAEIQFTASMTNDQEPGTVVPTLADGTPRAVSFGTAKFVLNEAQTALTFSASIFNIDVTGSQTPDLNDNLSAAHIHAGANFPPANNPVVWGFFGNPFNNNNPADGTLVPFASGVGGMFTGTWNLPEGNNTTLDLQIENLLAGRAYINFHTVQFPGGEIRGAILASSANTPEGGTTLVLLAGALLGLCAVRRVWMRG